MEVYFAYNILVSDVQNNNITIILKNDHHNKCTSVIIYSYGMFFPCDRILRFTLFSSVQSLSHVRLFATP